MDYYPCGIALLFTCLGDKRKGAIRKMKRTRISVLLVIALLLQLYAPLTAGAADFTPNPQTEYAKRFIAACDGQTWFINEIERLLNAQQRTLDTITGAEDLVEIKSHWSKRSEPSPDIYRLQSGNLVNCGICSSRIII